MEKLFRHKKIVFLIFFISLFSFSCNNEDNTLAPYSGSPELSGITVEDYSFNPKVTWIGGYVSVFGVNRGTKAALDTSLVWLIKTNGNNIPFPLKYGELPPGAQDITAQFGGTSLAALDEDHQFTFWVLKEDVWNQVSTHTNKELIDSSAGSSVTVSGDTTVFITPFSFSKGEKSVNVYINIVGLRVFGPLADVSVQSTTSNIPRINWRIKAAGITDTLVAAIGLVKGAIYDNSAAIWEVYSIRDSSGQNIFARDNVITGPVMPGDDLPNTRAFIEFLPENLDRGVDYIAWIADKTWDRENRQRFTRGYAYATFRIE